MDCVGYMLMFCAQPFLPAATDRVNARASNVQLVAAALWFSFSLCRAAATNSFAARCLMNSLSMTPSQSLPSCACNSKHIQGWFSRLRVHFKGRATKMPFVSYHLLGIV